MIKPELLLPAGNTETFSAAIEGGADAVYLGLKKFNARKRARNFTENDLINIISEAHRNKCKVYVTLNTLIKNNELSELVNYLSFLNQVVPDAVIVQDFATIALINKYFRNLKIHASTQMSSHNSAAAIFFKNAGIERIILSRELTASELKETAKNSILPVEVFVHGALCYSFSGQCLFSSYLGGNSANRGMCAQVCRRNFNYNNNKSALFSLKDFELIDYIPFYSEIGVASLKIEGRMKNAEYIYNTARAYRMAIDNHNDIENAKEILKFDFAREKTSWFMGKKVDQAITNQSGTGIFAGKITALTKNSFTIPALIDINKGWQLRIRNNADTETDLTRVLNIDKQNNNYLVTCENQNLNVGDEVYLAGTSSYTPKQIQRSASAYKVRSLTPQQTKVFTDKLIKLKPAPKDKQFYLRISDPEFIRKINLHDYSAIFLKTTFANLEKIAENKINIHQKSKIKIELPAFISEKRLKSLGLILQKLHKNGFTGFVINHISQLEIIPKGSSVFSAESVYLLNDVSVSFAQSLGISEYCYPQESDYPNLLRGKDRNGIVPIYFHPALFYSRMPVKSSKTFNDERGKKFVKRIENGFTIIADTAPVSFTHFAEKLYSKGFRKMLIDFSHETEPAKLAEIIKAIKSSSKIAGSNDFNFKKELH
jgi:U32 family peptidase